MVREVIVTCRNEAHAHELTAKAAAVEGVRVLEVGDRTFLAHQGGKLAVVSKLPLKSPDDLSVAYTPGVGRVSQAIAADPEHLATVRDMIMEDEARFVDYGTSPVWYGRVEVILS